MGEKNFKKSMFDDFSYDESKNDKLKKAETDKKLNSMRQMLLNDERAKEFALKLTQYLKEN